MEPITRALPHRSHLQFSCCGPVSLEMQAITFRIRTFWDRGWDQTGSNGANLSFPQEFGLTSETGNPRAEINEWIVGVINAG